jgi:hypothetical protein
MSALELELPLHLYTENKEPDGVVAGLNYSADKLVAWADCGRGDAVDRLCEQVLERDLEVIEAWKENQFLLLDETWMAVENGINDIENEKQYGLACDAVNREAEGKDMIAEQKKKQRKSDIEKLILQSREFVAANQPVYQESGAAGYLLALAAFSVLVYVLYF